MCLQQVQRDQILKYQETLFHTISHRKRNFNEFKTNLSEVLQTSFQTCPYSHQHPALDHTINVHPQPTMKKEYLGDNDKIKAWLQDQKPSTKICRY